MKYYMQESVHLGKRLIRKPELNFLMRATELNAVILL